MNCAHVTILEIPGTARGSDHFACVWWCVCVCVCVGVCVCVCVFIFQLEILLHV